MTVRLYSINYSGHLLSAHITPAALFLLHVKSGYVDLVHCARLVSEPTQATLEYTKGPSPLPNKESTKAALAAINVQNYMLFHIPMICT